MNNQSDEFKNARFLSVSALNRYLAYKFDIDVHLQNVYLEGEISNFKVSGKHFYFSIKDEFSEISAMMFYPSTKLINFDISDGMQVKVVGKVGVYEKRGTYSIICKKIEKSGIGALYQEFLDLKEKLNAEGLFDAKYKKTIPEFPKKIAVVTSPTGEAINDIISTINKRYPLVEVVLYPALVQGNDAPKDLIRALNSAYQDGTIDCLIIGRGGGSFEDLACFNDEELARTLFSAPFPTISAVGHEGDFSICDFVASLRAPTPTGAAMLACKDKKDIIENINILEQRLRSAYRSYLEKVNIQYQNIANSYALTKFNNIINNYESQYFNLFEKLRSFSPKTIIEQKIDKIEQTKDYLNLYLNHIINQNNQKYDFLTNNLQINFINKIKNIEDRINVNIDKLILLNPLNLMKKGYSIAYQNNNVISSVKDININQTIKIKMSDGEITTNIIEIKEEKNGK